MKKLFLKAGGDLYHGDIWDMAHGLLQPKTYELAPEVEYPSQ